MHDYRNDPTFKRRLTSLRELCDLVVADLPILEHNTDRSDDLAAYFIDRLRIALDNGLGCVLLAEEGLSAPVATVTRSMLEGVLTTYWASLSDANAASFAHGNAMLLARDEDAFISAWLPAARSMLKATHLIVVHRVREHRPMSAEEIIAILNLPR